MSDKETNDYSLITDISESVKEYFKKHNSSDVLDSGDTIREKVNSISADYSSSDKVFKGISLSDVILGFSVGSMAVVFSKNKFCICSNLPWGKYKDFHVFDIKDFIYLGHDKDRMLKNNFYVGLSTDGKFISQFQKGLSNQKVFLEKRKHVQWILNTELAKVKKRNTTEEEKEKTKLSQIKLLKQFDKDNNGIVDVVESNDLQLLLKEHQEAIKSIDQSYLQKFVKVSSWLVAKKQNIQQVFNSIKTSNESDKIDFDVQNPLIESLPAEVHVYEQVLFNALNMVSALIDDDMLTFYEIENAFDELNIFDSKLEKDISEKLSNIGDGLNAFVNEMNQSTNRIIESVQTLTYVTAKTNERLEGHLKGINSSIKVGNLINSINTYQNWRQKNLSDVKSQ